MQQQLLFTDLPPVFHGDDYQKPRDHTRLKNQLETILDLLKKGSWYSLPQLSEMTGYMTSSISAQIRNARKERNGGYTIEKKYIENGLYLYRLVL